MIPPDPISSPPVPEVDPYRYGWRYVRRERPDGTADLEKVPLTLEDTLHPQEEDQIPVRPLHEMECSYLAGAFRSRPVHGEPITFVAADWRIDWGVKGIEPHTPDVTVFVGLKEPPNLRRGTLRLAESGGRCVLAVEVVSPDTRVNDVVHKVREYYQAGVPLYVIVDEEGAN